MNSSGFESGIQQAQTAFGGLGSSISAASIAAGQVLGNLVTSAAGAVSDFGRSAIETGKAYEAGISQIAATLGYSLDELAEPTSEAAQNMEALSAKAEEMGRTTSFTAADAAEGLNILAMAGFDASTAIEMIPTVLNLAKAGSMGLGEAASYVAGSMKGFTGEAGDFADALEASGTYADIMAAGATKANTSVSELGAALSGSSAIASSYGQSSTEAGVALLRLAEQSVTGSAAATALSAVMKDLYAGTDQAKAALEGLGVSAYDSSGEARNLNDVVGDLDAALSQLTTQERADLENVIFGIQGKSAFDKMVATTGEKLESFYDAIETSSGSAAQQAETMAANVQGAGDSLQSALEGFEIAIFKHLSEPLQQAQTMGADALNALTDGLEAGGVRGALESLGSFISEKFTEVWQSVKLPPAVQNIADKLKEIFNKVRDAIGSLNLGEKFSAAFEGIKGAFDRVRTTISEAVQGWNLPEVFSGLAEKIRGAFDTVRGVIDGLNLGEAFSGVGEKVRGAFEKVREVIGGIDLSVAFSGIVEKVRGAFDAVRAAVGGIDFAGIFSGITEKIGGVVGTIRDAIGNIDLSGALGGISEALAGFSGSIRPFIEEKFEKAAEIFNSIKSGLGGLIDSFKNVELPDLSGFVTGVKNLFGAYELVNETKMGIAVSAIKGFLDAFKSADIAGLITEIAGGAAELFKAFGIAAYDTISGVSSAVGSFVDAFVDSGALASVIGDIAEGAKNLIGGIMKGSADTISAIGIGIKNFLNAFSESSIPGIIGEIATNAAAFFNTIATVTGDLIAGIGSGIKTFIAGFDNKGAVGLIGEVAQWVGDLFGFFTGGISGIITSIANAFSGFGDKVAELWNTAGPSLSNTAEAFHAFADNVRDSIDRFKAVVQPVAEWLASVFSVGIQMVVQNVIRVFGNLWDAAMNVITFLQEGFGGFVDLMQGDVSGAIEHFKTAWENMKEFFGNLVEQLLIPFRTLVSVLGDEGNKGVAAIKAPFEAAFQWFVSVGTNIVNGIKSGLSAAWSGLTSWFDEKINGLVGGVLNLLGIHSPSTVFAGIGRNMVLGLREGWTNTFSDFESRVDRDVRRLTYTTRVRFEDSAIGKSSAAGISSMLAANSVERGGEPVRINLMLDGDVAASALYDPLRRTAFQKGQSSGGEAVLA